MTRTTAIRVKLRAALVNGDAITVNDRLVQRNGRGAIVISLVHSNADRDTGSFNGPLNGLRWLHVAMIRQRFRTIVSDRYIVAGRRTMAATVSVCRRSVYGSRTYRPLAIGRTVVRSDSRTNGTACSATGVVAVATSLRRRRPLLTRTRVRRPGLQYRYTAVVPDVSHCSLTRARRTGSPTRVGP